MAYFDVVIQSSASLHAPREPDEYIIESHAVIRYYRDRDGKAFRAGKMHAYRIQADLAGAASVSLFDVCDAHSQPLLECHHLIYEPKGYCFRESIVHQFDALESDCLLLDYILLHPRWRGLRIGLMATRRLVDLLGGGCGLVVSEILPLRHEAHDRLRVPASWIPKHVSEEEEQEARRKLRRYFRRLGFQRIGKTTYYGLSMLQRTPSAEDMLRPGEDSQ
jgi:hypothetical protein